MKILGWALFLLFCLRAYPQHRDFVPGGIYEGYSLAKISLDEALHNLTPGTIVIISELHDNISHHQNQLEALIKIKSKGFDNLSLGMEFFNYTHQSFVDDFLDGLLQEKDFLEIVTWPGDNWESYRPIVLFPRQTLGKTLALNLPRSITQKVAQNGLQALLPNEIQQLPPNWSLGNSHYFERFKRLMEESHIPETSLMRYFTAQSLWDETMAWRAVKFMKENPEQILLIIVGDFHTSYGGGLPDKIRERGWKKMLCFSQVDLEGLSELEREEIMLPHPRYGTRSDFIWVGSP